MLDIREISRRGVLPFQSIDEQLPTGHRFTAPQPHATRDTHKHRAHVLDHKNVKDWLLVVRIIRAGGDWRLRAGNREDFAHVSVKQTKNFE